MTTDKSAKLLALAARIDPAMYTNPSEDDIREACYELRQCASQPVEPTTQVDNLKSPSDLSVPVETVSELKCVAPVVPDGYMLVKIEPEAKRLRDLLETVMRQTETDLAAAHEEICKLQGLDPTKHTWPQWTSPANTLRWFNELRAQLVAPYPTQPQPSSEQPAMSKSMAKRIAAQRENSPFDEFAKLVTELERDHPEEMERASEWVRQKFYSKESK